MSTNLPHKAVLIRRYGSQVKTVKALGISTSRPKHLENAIKVHLHYSHGELQFDFSGLPWAYALTLASLVLIVFRLFS